MLYSAKTKFTFISKHPKSIVRYACERVGCWCVHIYLFMRMSIKVCCFVHSWLNHVHFTTRFVNNVCMLIHVHKCVETHTHTHSQKNIIVLFSIVELVDSMKCGANYYSIQDSWHLISWYWSNFCKWITSIPSYTFEEIKESQKWKGSTAMAHTHIHNA